MQKSSAGKFHFAPPFTSFDHLIGAQSFWQATKHEHNASPVGSAQANDPEVFSVEPEDFPAAKHMCKSSVDRESKCPISSRQHNGSNERSSGSSVKSRRLSARAKASNTNLSLAKPSRSPRANAAIPSRRSRNSTSVALRLRRAS